MGNKVSGKLTTQGFKEKLEQTKHEDLKQKPSRSFRGIIAKFAWKPDEEDFIKHPYVLVKTLDYSAEEKIDVVLVKEWYPLLHTPAYLAIVYGSPKNIEGQHCIVHAYSGDNYGVEIINNSEQPEEYNKLMTLKINKRGSP